MHPISWTDLKRVIAYLPPTYDRDNKGELDLERPLRRMHVVMKHEPGRGYWISDMKIFANQIQTGPEKKCLLAIWPPGEWTSNQPNVRTWIVTQTGAERRYGKLESVVKDLRRLCGDTPAQIDLRIYPDEKA